VDKTTNCSVNSTVGKCDRADNCGHHYTPSQYFADNHFDTKKVYAPIPKQATQPKPQPSFIDESLMKRSLAGYENNNFAKWLVGLVGQEKAMEAIKRYKVGTTKTGGTVWYQVDKQGKIRAGKIMHYGDDGHRRKDVVPPVQWLHSLLKLPDFHLSQCMFGENLLSYKSNPVAIVESEKSAVIASIYLPHLTWLACGGSEGLSAEKCAVLKNRNVILYPDCGQYEKWSAKAMELSKACSMTVTVSDLIEKNATAEEYQAGFDIADYLIGVSPDDNILKMLNTAVIPDTEPEHPSLDDNEPGRTVYVDDNGVLYIPPLWPDYRPEIKYYTTYPCIAAYNERMPLASFVPFKDVDTTGMTKKHIDIETLTIAS
jgi:hypothetical protein